MLKRIMIVAICLLSLGAIFAFALAARGCYEPAPAPRSAGEQDQNRGKRTSHPTFNQGYTPVSGELVLNVTKTGNYEFVDSGVLVCPRLICFTTWKSRRDRVYSVVLLGPDNGISRKEMFRGDKIEVKNRDDERPAP